MKYLPLMVALCFVLTSCDSTEPYGATEATSTPASVSKTDNGKACWGQASAVFAAMGEMGEHSSEQENPRLGLRNLARALFEAGVIPDNSLQALGEFVAAELGLSIDACGT